MLSSSTSNYIKRTACILSLTTLSTLGAAGGTFIGTAIGANKSLESTANTMQSEWRYCQQRDSNNMTACIFSLKRNDSLSVNES